MPGLGRHDLVLCTPPLSHVPFFERLEPARSAGFTAVSILPAEVRVLAEQGMAPAELRRRINDHGLGIAELDCMAAWLPQQSQGGSHEIPAMLASLTPDKVLPIAAELGAPSVVLIEVSGITLNLDEAIESFARLCDRAREYGLKIHIEFVPFGGIPDLKTAWRIVEGAGRSNGGLTIDSWHFFRSGSTLAELGVIPGQHIHTIQLNDAPATPSVDLLDETLNHRLLPGEGALDLKGLLQTLNATGTTAPIGIEVFSEKTRNQSMAENARQWAEAARNVLTGTGFQN